MGIRRSYLMCAIFPNFVCVPVNNKTEHIELIEKYH